MIDAIGDFLEASLVVFLIIQLAMLAIFASFLGGVIALELFTGGLNACS